MLLIAGGTRLLETSTVAKDQRQIADRHRTRFELVFNEISTCQPPTAVGHKRVCGSVKWEWAFASLAAA